MNTWVSRARLEAERRASTESHGSSLASRSPSGESTAEFEL